MLEEERVELEDKKKGYKVVNGTKSTTKTLEINVGGRGKKNESRKVKNSSPQFNSTTVE